MRLHAQNRNKIKKYIYSLEEDEIKKDLSNQLKSNVSSNYMDLHNSQIFITRYSSIEGYLFSPELLIKYNIDGSYARIIGMFITALIICLLL